MAGRLVFWGKSEKTHDRLLRSLPPLAQKVAESFHKVQLSLRAIRDHAEEVGKLAAEGAKMAYPVEAAKGARAIAAASTIAKTLDETRSLMPDRDVAVYRSNLRSMIGLQRSARGEIQKLARLIKQSEDVMLQIQKFYPAKPPGRSTRSTRKKK